MTLDGRPPLALEVDGASIEVDDDGGTLLDVLRDRLGVRSPKDGCSPQGQCGCCTVLVDGQPRVACVTPARRVAGRRVTTVDGLEPDERQAWGAAFSATGGSQCGFCTPGIVVRLAALRRAGTGPDDLARVRSALLAHLCRCTGWQTILDAWAVVGRPDIVRSLEGRDLERAARRAALEGRTPQRVGPDVALGHGGFAADVAPLDALVAVPAADGGWAVGETLAEARARAGSTPGRRTSASVTHPLEPPPGPWNATLRTTWVEPAYLELDASWCAPGGTPASALANGGAFGGKLSSPVTALARRLADEHGRPVRVVLSREDATRLGPKRPPVAGGVRADGTGVLRVARTAGIVDAIAAFAPALEVEEVDVAGPPTSAALRAAGWAEAAVLLAGAGRERGPVAVVSPRGARAEAEVVAGSEPIVRVRVRCGDPLDEVVLRSYCIGAAHMALGWVTSEGLAVDGHGVVHDLTIRSFGVLRAVDTPRIEVEVEPSDEPPVNGSDAVFAAVAAAVWRSQGHPPDWPTGRPLGAPP